jgi:anaerobic dimethyl sulfoxide reductase subunit A
MKKPDVTILNPARRSFLKTSAAGTVLAGSSGLLEIALGQKDAAAFAYEPYYRDDQLTTVVTSCDHNCGSRHMLVAHKKGNVIVRLSSDDGRYQAGGEFGKDTVAEPQLRACLRGRSYRSRLYSPSVCSTRCCALANGAKENSSASRGMRRSTISRRRWSN